MTSSNEGAAGRRGLVAGWTFRPILRGVSIGLLFLAILAGVWEGAKALGGDPWRFTGSSG